MKKLWLLIFPALLVGCCNESGKAEVKMERDSLKVMEFEYGYSYTPIDAEHPLINYYGAVAVPDIEFVDIDNEKQKILRKEICTII